MIRKATYEEAESIQSLISIHSEKGQMLFRPLEEIRRDISDFWVFEKSGQVAGVCNLKTSWEKVVEIRSLCVHPKFYRRGVGTDLVKVCVEEALALNNKKIFVFTYAVPLFLRLGFAVVEKNTQPAKIWNDCQGCVHQDNCDETAMVLPLNPLKIDWLKNLPLKNTCKVLY